MGTLPTVDILIPTYNHENYIAQAIDSALSQITEFEFKLIIGVDKSKDNTLSICDNYKKSYQDRITLLRHDSNIGMAANYESIFNASDAKYISILEGDDYWIDTRKLQKQVDILEKDGKIGLVHSNFYSLYDNGIKKTGHTWQNNNQLSGKLIGPTQTVEVNINPLTTCFRSELAISHVDFRFLVVNSLLTIDIMLWSEICRRSEVYYIPDITGVYRVHKASLTGNKEIEAIERFNKTRVAIVSYLMDKYDTPLELKEAFSSKNSIELIYQYLLANEKSKLNIELAKVNHVTSIRDRVVCFVAKYPKLRFVIASMHWFRLLGSSVKQFIVSLINLRKTP